MRIDNRQQTSVSSRRILNLSFSHDIIDIGLEILVCKDKSSDYLDGKLI